MADDDLSDEDVSAIYDLAWRQIKEDRDDILKAYNELRNLLSGSMERYAVSGDTLAKFADMRVKQTGQVVELLKIMHKNKESDDGLSFDDFEKIKDSIEKK